MTDTSCNQTMTLWVRTQRCTGWKILIFIGIDGAEGKVFSCSGRLGEDVEEGGLAHVWQAHNAHLEVGAHTAN